jgi:hypothetical protein
MPDYNPCLVIIFNHKYDKNIPQLEALYSSKFKNIYFLVPFYKGDNPRVIPVYESSFYFQGYIAQGFRDFYDPRYSHYIFIGDDLIINPVLNEHNFAESLGIKQGESYISELVTFDGRVRTGPYKTVAQPAKSSWGHTIDAVNFYSNRKGSETKGELPSKEVAEAKLKSAGLDVQPLKFSNIFGKPKTPASISGLLSTCRKYWTYYVSWKHLKVAGDSSSIQLSYPLVYGYSDIVVVASDIITEFSHYCGVFASMGLFVEIAIPTALLLCSNRVLTDEDTKLKGEALWLGDIAGLEEKYQLNLQKMLTDFPSEKLFYHPVKLSRWR